MFTATRKKIFGIAMVLVFLCAIILVGCANKNKFIEVSSVTFTSNGQTQTIYSTWFISRGNYEASTQSEYNSAEFKTSVTAPSDTTINTISFYAENLFKGNIYDIKTKPYKPYNITKKDVGKYFYIYAHDFGGYNNSYYKVEIKGVGAIYTQVKILNNTTIVVKRGTIETTYTVTSYSIKK